MKIRRIIACLLLVCLCATLCLAAQPSSAHSLRYDNLLTRNLWLQGTNVAGMRADSLNASVASIGASFGHNDFKHTWGEASNQWSADAGASSVVHLKKFSMAGSFSFSQTMLYNACGSMFMDSGRFPVDIFEYTPGTKSLQKYYFDGGISVDVCPTMRVGGQIAFQSANCAKRKDLRYTDYALDFIVRPSVQWHNNEGAIGASFLFERNTETISAEQIGEASVPYYAFLDKGMYYGVETVWDGAALHIKEDGVSGFPVIEMGLGAAIQGSWKSLYAEFSFLHANGKVGEKDAVWFTFPSNRFRGTLAWKYESCKGTENVFRLDVSYKKTVLQENIIEKSTTGGVTTRSTYGNNVILQKGVFCVSPSWKAFRADSFEASVVLSYSRNEGLGTQIYPTWNSQVLRKVAAEVGCRFISGAWSVLGDCALGKGWLKEEDGIDSSASGLSVMNFPLLNTSAYDVWKSYNTRCLLSMGFGVRRDWNNGLFLQANIGMATLGTSADLCPRASLRLGIEF